MRFIKFASVSVAGLGIAGMLLLAGCNSNNGGVAQVHGLSGDDADKMNAARSSTDVIEDKPLTAETHYAAGQLAESQNSLARAMDQYSAALKVDPKHLPSLYRLAVVHAELKQYSQAIENWKKYIELTDGAAAGYSNLGFCYELSGHPEMAENAYKAGIAKEPTNEACRMNYGLMLARHGQITQATLQLQAVLSPAEVHYNLASVYEMQGRKTQAKDEYQKALQLDPGLFDAQARLDSLN